MTETQRRSTVGYTMSRTAIVIRADASLTEAALLMDDHRISGMPVGVLSLTDIVHAIAEGIDVPPVAAASEAPDA